MAQETQTLPDRPEPTTVEKLRGLPWSFATNAANTVFAQFTYFGSVFVLFLNALGLTKTEIGLILAFAPFAAIVAPLIAPLVARLGYKRIFVTFYALRKGVTLFLLFTPWVIATWGGQAAFLFVAGVVVLFSLARAIEETAYYPWLREFVPSSVQGKYSAMSNIFTAIVGFLSVLAAGLVIERSVALNGFMVLFAIGIAFGFLSVAASSFIPGGHPDPQASRQRQLRDAVGNRDFRRYLLGIAFLTLGTVPLASFLPLYMQDVIGLAPGNVVLLQMGTLLGSLASSYLWGWAADRYGSKPIMLSGAIVLVTIPFFWWTIPRQIPWTLAIALTIAFVQGVANLGWAIGAGRILFVDIVPPEKRMDYLALHFAWIGLVSGASQLLGGVVLDLSAQLEGKFFGFVLNPYLLIFVAAVCLPLASILLLRHIRTGTPLSAAAFAGLFLRGNPFLAMGALIRFHQGPVEADAVRLTERMGAIGSPLNADELLVALSDPRFNVRYEAVLAIARTRTEPRLVAALETLVHGNNPALSAAAAWALGKVGGASSIDCLRRALDSPYRSIQAHAARSLGALKDRAIAPLLLERLHKEEDEGLRIAYASTLGLLQVDEAIEPVLEILLATDDESDRMELALAVARIVGDERAFVQLARSMQVEPSTAAAQALEGIRRLYRRRQGELDAVLKDAIEAFGRDDPARGIGAILAALEIVSSTDTELDRRRALVLTGCARHVAAAGGWGRSDCLLLLLHILGR